MDAAVPSHCTFKADESQGMKSERGHKVNVRASKTPEQSARGEMCCHEGLHFCSVHSFITFVS